MLTIEKVLHQHENRERKIKVEGKNLDVFNRTKFKKTEKIHF